MHYLAISGNNYAPWNYTRMALTGHTDPMAIHNVLNHTSTEDASPIDQMNRVRRDAKELRASPWEFTPVSRSCSSADTPKSAAEDWSSDSSRPTPLSSPEPIAPESRNKRPHVRESEERKQKKPRAERPEYSIEERDFLWFCKYDLKMDWQQIRKEFTLITTSDPKKGHLGTKTPEASIQCKTYRLADTINRLYGEDPSNPGHPRVPGNPIIRLPKERGRRKTLEARMKDGIRGNLPQNRYWWMPELAERYLVGAEISAILRWPEDEPEMVRP